MPPKRRPEEESPQAAALKKRCRSFDL